MTTPPSTLPTRPSGRFESSPDHLLRKVFGTFATGVAVVTTCDLLGQPVGLTINSFTSVSLRPPMVLWCLRTQSASMPVFESSRHFAVNILSAEQVRLAQRFASAEPDRFGSVDWSLGVAGQPILSHVSAWMVCERKPVRLPVGDHRIYFGQVVSARRYPHEPLLFADGSFMQLSDMPV